MISSELSPIIFYVSFRLHHSMKPSSRKAKTPTWKVKHGILVENGEKDTVVKEHANNTKKVDGKKLEVKGKNDKKVRSQLGSPSGEELKRQVSLSHPIAEEEDVNIDTTQQIRNQNIDDKREEKDFINVKNKRDQKQENKQIKQEDTAETEIKRQRLVSDEIATEESLETATSHQEEAFGKIRMVDVKSLLGHNAVTSSQPHASQSSGAGKVHSLTEQKIGRGRNIVAYDYKPQPGRGTPRIPLQRGLLRPRILASPGVRQPLAPRLGPGPGRGLRPRLHPGQRTRMPYGLGLPPGPSLHQVFHPRALTFSPGPSRFKRPPRHPSDNGVVTIEDDEDKYQREKKPLCQDDAVETLPDLPSCITVTRSSEVNIQNNKPEVNKAYMIIYLQQFKM